MAKQESPIDPYEQTAPEYTEYILWHRIFAAVGVGLAVLIAIAWGSYVAFAPDEETSPLEPAGFQAKPFAQSQAPIKSEIEPVIKTQAVANVTETAIEERAVEPSEEEPQHAVAQEKGQNSSPKSVAATPAVTEPIASSEVEDHATVKSSAMEESNTVATENVATAKPQWRKLEPSVNEPSDEPAIKPESIQPEEPIASTAQPNDYPVDVEILSSNISKASLTDSMQGLEPKHALTSTESLNADFIKLYFFTDLKGRAGDTLTYTWFNDQKQMAKVRIPVGSDRWRSHSSKNFSKNMRGDWRVVVKDKNGNVLAKASFTMPDPSEKYSMAH